VAALQKVVLQAFGEVETALAADAFLARRESALKEAVALANEADTEARAAYRDGVGDILTVFAAQNRRLATEAQAITVRRLRLDNRINLHLALGGDYPPSG
jgi:multidrug efflux system outer membrane protein